MAADFFVYKKSAGAFETDARNLLTMNVNPQAIIMQISGRIGRTNQRVERSRETHAAECAHAAALVARMVSCMLALEVSWVTDIVNGADPNECGVAFMETFDDYAFLLLSVNAALRSLP